MARFTGIMRAVMDLEPQRTQIEYAGQAFRWGQLADTVRAIGRLLDDLALPVDARVGILLRNRPGHVAAVGAVVASERCLVTLNPVLPDDRLFADVAGLGLRAVILDTSDTARPGLVAAISGGGSAVIAIDPLLGGADLLAPPGDAARAFPTAPGVAVEMLTSGTTGAPKRVPLTRAAFDASFERLARYERGRSLEDAPQLRPGTGMIANPMTHIGGLFGCIAAWVAGRAFVLLEKFSVDAWVDAVRRHRMTVAPAVPTAVRMLLDARPDAADLSSLSVILCGTAPLPADLVDAFLDAYGIPILGNYGATEFSGAVAGWSLADFRAHWADKRGAAGRMHDNAAARVVDGDSGRELPRGQEGILELQGEQIGPAYRVGEDAWLRTTDRAVLDADDFLFIRGRADNAIVRGGFKVHPDDVVAALHAHPAVREAAVVGVPDARLGAVPAAAIILRDGADAPAADALQAWLRDRLIAYQVPVHIRYVEDFPRTPSLKPSAPGLRALFADGGDA